MEDTILLLEKQGFRFAPRAYGFDYYPPGPLTVAQAKMIIRLKEMDKEVCQHLSDRAKYWIGKCLDAVREGAQE